MENRDPQDVGDTNITPMTRFEHGEVYRIRGGGDDAPPIQDTVPEGNVPEDSTAPQDTTSSTNDKDAAASSPGTASPGTQDTTGDVMPDFGKTPSRRDKELEITMKDNPNPDPSKRRNTKNSSKLSNDTQANVHHEQGQGTTPSDTQLASADGNQMDSTQGTLASDVWDPIRLSEDEERSLESVAALAQLVRDGGTSHGNITPKRNNIMSVSKATYRGIPPEVDTKGDIPLFQEQVVSWDVRHALKQHDLEEFLDTTKGMDWISVKSYPPGEYVYQVMNLLSRKKACALTPQFALYIPKLVEEKIKDHRGGNAYWGDALVFDSPTTRKSFSNDIAEGMLRLLRIKAVNQSHREPFNDAVKNSIIASTIFASCTFHAIVDLIKGTHEGRKWEGQFVPSVKCTAKRILEVYLDDEYFRQAFTFYDRRLELLAKTHPISRSVFRGNKKAHRGYYYGGKRIRSDDDATTPENAGNPMRNVLRLSTSWKPEDRPHPSPEKEGSTTFKGDPTSNVEFPSRTPFKLYTHYSGRWVQDEHDADLVKWEFYEEPLTEGQLPVNVPTPASKPEHWVNRMMPNGSWTTKYDPKIPLPYVPKTQPESVEEATETGDTDQDPSSSSNPSEVIPKTLNYDESQPTTQPDVNAPEAQSSIDRLGQQDQHVSPFKDEDPAIQNIVRANSILRRYMYKVVFAQPEAYEDPPLDNRSIDFPEYLFDPSLEDDIDERMDIINKGLRQNVIAPIRSEIFEQAKQHRVEPHIIIGVYDAAREMEKLYCQTIRTDFPTTDDVFFVTGLRDVDKARMLAMHTGYNDIFKMIRAAHANGPNPPFSISGNLLQAIRPKNTRPKNAQVPTNAPPKNPQVPTNAPPSVPDAQPSNQARPQHRSKGKVHFGSSSTNANNGSGQKGFPLRYEPLRNVLDTSREVWSRTRKQFGDIYGNLSSGLSLSPITPDGNYSTWMPDGHSGGSTQHNSSGYGAFHGGSGISWDGHGTPPDSGGFGHWHNGYGPPQPPAPGGSGGAPPPPPPYGPPGGSGGNGSGPPPGSGGGGSGPPPGGPPPMSVPSIPPAEFRVKPDRKDYPILNNDTQYRHWKDQVIAVATAHGMHEVFDYTYRPANSDENVLFTRKNAWIYMVLTFIVKTFEGIALVQQHRRTFDARSVMYHLDRHYSVSTAAVLSLSDILSFLTSDKLDSTYRKPLSQYIIEWVDKATTYNEQSSDRISDNMLKTMLQNAVSGVTALRQVKNDDLQRVIRGQPPLTFGQYITILKSAAQTQDEGYHRRRSAHVLEASPDDTADTLEVNRIESDLRLPDSIYNQLDLDDRKLWNTFSEDARRRLVRSLGNAAPSRPSPRNRRRVNVTAIEPTEDENISDPEVPPSSDDTREVNQTETSTSTLPDTHPGDVRRVLAQASSPGTKKPANRQVTTLSVAPSAYQVNATEYDDYQHDHEFPDYPELWGDSSVIHEEYGEYNEWGGHESFDGWGGHESSVDHERGGSDGYGWNGYDDEMEHPFADFHHAD